MQLAPFSSSTAVMLANVPLTGTVHLEARGIDDDVTRSVPRTYEQRQIKRALAPAKRSVIGHREIECHELDQGSEEALGGA
jgi:hypothetical protein